MEDEIIEIKSSDENMYQTKEEAHEELRRLEDKVIQRTGRPVHAAVISHDEIDPKLMGSARFAINMFTTLKLDYLVRGAQPERMKEFVETARYTLYRYENLKDGLTSDDIRCMRKIILPAYDIHKEAIAKRTENSKLN